MIRLNIIAGIILMSSICSSALSSGFEGIVTFGGEIYPDQLPIGGGEGRMASPYVPTIAPLKDGRLLLVSHRWRAGDFEPVPKAGAYGITSSDGGKSWSDPFALRLVDGGYVHHGYGTLLRLKSGTLGMVCFDAFYRSEDEGETWIGPVPIGLGDWGGHVRNDGAIVLTSGRIIAPLYAYPKLAPAGGRRTLDFSFGVARYSDDEGRTWHSSENILLAAIEGGRQGFYMWDEWSVVELENGDLLGLGRTELGRLYRSISKDQGQTWEQTGPTNLAATSAPCIVRRIPDSADLLVIWNQGSAEEIRKQLIRHRLSCAISRDGGQTWENFKNLESLDDVAQIEPGPVQHYEREEEKYSGYQQPEDRQRYHKAPGPLRVAYPTCTFHEGNAIITYGYGCNTDTLGDVFCKIKVLPISWFYE